jgi:hypothetical protein
MKTPVATVPPKIQQAQEYGQEIARINIPRVMIGEMPPDQLDDMVDRHIVSLIAAMREKSDLDVEGMAEAIGIIANEIRKAFDAETKLMLLNRPAGAGRA